MAKVSDADFFFLKEHKNFLRTELYKKLQKDYTHLFLDFCYDDSNTTYKDGGVHRQNQHDASVLYYSIFIYLNSIINNSHTMIADIGCGHNFLKKYFPKIIGYDNTKFADYNEFFNDEFILKHQNEFDVAIAINSLHNVPLDQFSNRINDFAKIIKPNGYGFVTLNIGRLLNKTDKHFLQKFGQLEDFYNYFNQEVKKITHNVIVYDNLILHNQKIQDEKNYELYKSLCGTDWPSYQDLTNNKYTCTSPIILKEINDYKKIIQQHPDYKLVDPFNGVIRLIFKKS